ncbi:hypothetical protein [Neomegalonema sp.]|uniref:hypothetical protein n=1 Tax=Neomegalonema sp. TaxID=2039713 RepID=UPI0026339C7D|nr:hypothetical protein [Neomegalonema sp.]MDD2867490.1 hypothetical protein [Neomegalonema sp.]
MTHPPFLALCLCAALVPFSAQALCRPQFRPVEGDMRMQCAPDFWERGFGHGSMLRSGLHFHAPANPDRRERAQLTPALPVCRQTALRA